MNGTRLNHIFHLEPQTKHMFLGLGNPDIIPSIYRVPAILILNTAPLYTEGEHWCIVCFDKEQNCYFFDPYGREPAFYNFMPILSRVADNLAYNSKRVQGEQAKTCGHHCVYFGRSFAYGTQVDEIIKTYSDNLRYNDNMVYNYVRHYYGDIISEIRV